MLGACPDSEAPLLLPEVPIQDIQYLIAFIYRGQVDVHQHHIASFLNTAKQLHILGLEEGDRVRSYTHSIGFLGRDSRLNKHL